MLWWFAWFILCLLSAAGASESIEHLVLSLDVEGLDAMLSPTSIASMYNGDHDAMEKCMRLAPLLLGNEARWMALFSMLQPGEYIHLTQCLLNPAMVPYYNGDRSFDGCHQVEGLIEGLLDHSPTLDYDSVEALFQGMIVLHCPRPYCLAARLGLTDFIEQKMEWIEDALELASLPECPKDLVSNTEIAMVIIEHFLLDMDEARLRGVFGEIAKAAILAEEWTLIIWLGEHYAPLRPLLAALVIRYGTAEDLNVISQLGYHFSIGDCDVAAEIGNAQMLQWIGSSEGVFPSQLGIDAAFAGGHHNVTEFLRHQRNTVVLPTEAAVRVACEHGNIKGLLYTCQANPSLCPPSPEHFALASKNGHLPFLEFAYSALKAEYRLDNKRGLSQRLHRLFDLVTGGIEYTFIHGHPSVLQWIFRGFDYFKVSFPSISTDTVKGCIRAKNWTSLKWYRDHLHRSIPWPLDGQWEGITKDIHLFEALAKDSISITPTMDDFVAARQLGDVDTVKYIHGRLQEQYPLSGEMLCDSIRMGHKGLFEWLSSEVISTSLKCDHHNGWDLKDEFIDSIYRVAHRRYGWLPSQADINQATLTGQYATIRWAHRVSDGNLFPSPDVIVELVVRRAIGTLRVLNHVGSVESCKAAFMDRAFRGDFDFIKWFPWISQWLVDHEYFSDLNLRIQTWALECLESAASEDDSESESGSESEIESEFEDFSREDIDMNSSMQIDAL